MFRFETMTALLAAADKAISEEIARDGSRDWSQTYVEHAVLRRGALSAIREMIRWRKITERYDPSGATQAVVAPT